VFFKNIAIFLDGYPAQRFISSRNLLGSKMIWLFNVVGYEGVKGDGFYKRQSEPKFRVKILSLKVPREDLRTFNVMWGTFLKQRFTSFCLKIRYSRDNSRDHQQHLSLMEY